MCNASLISLLLFSFSAHHSSESSSQCCFPLQLQSTGNLAPGGLGKMLGGRGMKRGDDMSSGGRLSRRNADPIAEAERKAQQEKLYSLDLERVLAGARSASLWAQLWWPFVLNFWSCISALNSRGTLGLVPSFHSFAEMINHRCGCLSRRCR